MYICIVINCKKNTTLSKISKSNCKGEHLVRVRPFNLKGGVMVFIEKNILIPNVAGKKYSDFGGGKQK
jgi:hypothetical protein